MVNFRELSDNWAYDLDKDPIRNGEIKDGDVLNQSIEMILATAFGERLFNPSFGAGLQYKIFNVFTTSEANAILDEVAQNIKMWEDRITVVESQMNFIINPDQNYVILIIPYIINRTGVKSVFKKKIIND